MRCEKVVEKICRGYTELHILINSGRIIFAKVLRVFIKSKIPSEKEALFYLFVLFV